MQRTNVVVLAEVITWMMVFSWVAGYISGLLGWSL